MKKVLYISNIEVPYRVRFFNELSKYCDLMVLYERKRSSNRNEQWAKSEAHSYRIKYLKGIKLGGENAFSLGILKEIFSGYDRIIVGCYNSPVQMMAILAMRLFRIPYILSLDGEPFLKGGGLKSKLKRFFLTGADRYLTAGEQAGKSLQGIVKDRKIIPYYFSSLSEKEIQCNAAASTVCRQNDTILVVSQYLPCKGNDVALEAARMDKTHRYKFVGMGSRTELFLQEHPIPENVEVIPFLQKPELEKEYQSCAMLVLPSRQECWGLVINEAASFGMPIVSTWGSGAAVEFLAADYPQYLAEPGNAQGLLQCIRALLASDDKETYSRFLREKAKDYSIERSVQAHLTALQ
jgi:glycosyltransferase involved in cell wall biosynthesis